MTSKEKGLREDAAIGIFSILFPIAVIVVFAALDHARVLSVYDLPFVAMMLYWALKTNLCLRESPDHAGKKRLLFRLSVQLSD